MQKRSIEEYIREMERMRKKAVPLLENVENVDDTLREYAVEEVNDDVFEQDRDDINEEEEILEEMTEDADIRDDDKENIGMGRLIVTVTAGGGLFPVENAAVVISEQSGSEIAAVKTDESGKTPMLYLPAPDRDNSQRPQDSMNAAETRAQYNITVSSPGYVTAVVEGVSVFDDVTAIQKVDMLTLSAADGDTSPRVTDEKTEYRL